MAQMKLSEREVRQQKVHDIKKWGVVPYANNFDKVGMIADVYAKHPQHISLEDGDGNLSVFRDIENIMEGPIEGVKTAGRIMLYRSHGKLSFAKLKDESGEIQLMFHRDFLSLKTIDKNTGELVSLSVLEDGEGNKLKAYKFLEKMTDVGDRLGVEGEYFYTHKGELTIFVSQMTFLAKAVQPLGDKFHGIGAGQETAYRQRYLDMIFNHDSLERFKLRSLFVRSIREFYWSRDFIEIETPVLGISASGAAAGPFKTHHNDFDIDMYLHIAPETSLKKATVGGLEKVFEFCKNFRNEGSSPAHHQEFTAVEHYAAYWNYEDNMRFTEDMFDHIFDAMPQLSRVVSVEDKNGDEKEVDFSTPWERIDYVAQIKKDSGIDVSLYGPEDEDVLRALIKKQGFERAGLDDQATATMIDYLYKKVTRPHIIGPAFIYNYPKTMQPLARVSDTDDNIVEQFQVVVNGWEINKAYSELVDPQEQQANFDAQGDALARGDEEATSGDDDFVKAMEYGMPPQSGWGMGIDRIFAMLTEQKNIRDVILFPLVKPEAEQGHTGNKATTSNVESKTPAASVVVEETSYVYKKFPTRASIDALAEKYLTDTLTHCQQVAAIMSSYASKLGQNVDEWYAVGLLHDVDRDVIAKDGDRHLDEDFVRMMDELFDEDSDRDHFVDIIRSHYDKWEVAADTLVKKYLLSIDELSGLIHAYSLMRPEGYAGMKWKSINKKIKDKKFAAGVDRAHVTYCESLLDIPLSEFAVELADVMAG